MRTIKFRMPMFNRSGKFFEWFYWGFIGDNGEFITPHSDYRNCPSQQFTGLTDANGKDIYEGDIVNAEFRTGGKGFNSTKVKNFLRPVQFYPKSGWAIDCNFTKGDYRFIPHLDECEVIGNIIENPELLTQ